MHLARQPVKQPVRVSHMYLSSVPNSIARCVLCLKQPLKLDLCALEGAPSKHRLPWESPTERTSSHPVTGGVPRVMAWGSRLGAHTQRLPCAAFSIKSSCLLNESLHYCLQKRLDQLCLFIRCLEIPGWFLQHHKRFAVDASRKWSNKKTQNSYNEGFWNWKKYSCLLSDTEKCLVASEKILLGYLVYMFVLIALCVFTSTFIIWFIVSTILTLERSDF